MMELRLVLEAIIYTLLYSAFIVVLVKRQGVIEQLYNYPPKIQQRAVELGPLAAVVGGLTAVIGLIR